MTATALVGLIGSIVFLSGMSTLVFFQMKSHWKYKKSYASWSDLKLLESGISLAYSETAKEQFEHLKWDVLLATRNFLGAETSNNEIWDMAAPYAMGLQHGLEDYLVDHGVENATLGEMPSDLTPMQTDLYHGAFRLTRNPHGVGFNARGYQNLESDIAAALQTKRNKLAETVNA